MRCTQQTGGYCRCQNTATNDKETKCGVHSDRAVQRRKDRAASNERDQAALFKSIRKRGDARVDVHRLAAELVNSIKDGELFGAGVAVDTKLVSDLKQALTDAEVN